MTAETVTSIRELDSRVTIGVQVRLLWCENDNSVWVSVIDTRNGEAFRLEVGPDERPRDVFAHPFAYAAAHRVSILPMPAVEDPVTAI